MTALTPRRRSHDEYIQMYRGTNHNYPSLGGLFADVGIEVLDISRYIDADKELYNILRLAGDPATAVETFRKLVKTFTHAEKCSVSWRRMQSSGIYLYTHLDDPEKPAKARIFIEDATSGFPSSIVAASLNEKTVKVINDPSAVPYRLKEGEVTSKYPVHAQITVPLSDDREFNTALNALNRPGGFDPTDVAIVYKAAWQARPAIAAWLPSLSGREQRR